MYKLRPCLVLKMEITIGMTIINTRNKRYCNRMSKLFICFFFSFFEKKALHFIKEGLLNQLAI